VHGPATDLHSGYFGGVVRNPLEALAQMLATLQRRRRPHRGPGFYDGVRALTPAERAELAALPFDAAREARRSACRARRRAGGAARTDVAPARRSRSTACTAAIKARAQDDRAVVRARESFRRGSCRARSRARQARVSAHLQRVAPPGVRVEIEASGDVRAVETSRDHPAVAAAARAMERGFGKPPVFIGTGGTIGPVSSFDRILTCRKC
jgi:acetylornithine deacetylase/succinyl-diaminopimelate desuccinylase-like protein